MFKFNTQGIPDSRQCPIDGVKEVVATCIILRSDPFSFHYSPQGFHKAQVRGIRWKVKEKKSAFLPQFSQFPYFLVSMYAINVSFSNAKRSESFKMQYIVLETIINILCIDLMKKFLQLMNLCPWLKRLMER